MTHSDQQPEDGQRSENRNTGANNGRASALGLIGILLVTAVAGIGRLLELDRYPGGLLDVEARHGLLARQSTDTGLRWLIDGAADLSSTLSALIAIVGSVSQFDATTPRVAAALFGAGSVFATGLWLRRELGVLCGLAGAAVVAGSFWHILFSRLALAPIVGAFSLAALLWCLAEATSRRGQAALPWYALTGVMAGIGFLSTPSLRLVLLAFLGIVGTSLYRSWQGDDQAEPRYWILTSVSALLIVSPFLLSHRSDLRTLTPWAPTPGLPGAEPANLLTILGAMISSATALFLPGDVERGLNLPDHAFLSLLLIPWAAIGLIGLFSASSNPAHRDRFIGGGLLLLAVTIGVSAVDAGHPGQLVVLSPLLAGLVVFGFRSAIQWARIRTVRYALVILVITGIAGDALWSWDRYVNEWARDLDTRQAFHVGTVAAILAVDDLYEQGPVFVSTVGQDDLLAYVVTPARRHTFDGARVLPFPADEDGYLLAPADSPLNPALEHLLDQVPELNSARDDSTFRTYRLDDRIRQEMPLSVPTVRYADGTVLYGSDLWLEADRETANVLIAWRVSAESPDYSVDIRLRTIDARPVSSEHTVTIPANPMGSGLFQVLAVSLEIPASDTDMDLEVRLRDDTGAVVRTPGITEDGYLLLNRYRIDE
jgi:hypothetical protein